MIFSKKKVTEPISPPERFRQSIDKQSYLINLVKETACPSCGNKLRMIAYENHYDSTTFEAAIICDKCSSRFIFTEIGLKGEYLKLESKPNESKPNI